MFALRAILLLLCSVASVAYADCGPETRADPAFTKSLERALKGDVVEQRNVAVSYEAGYLVKPCFAKAYYWYKQAAKQGDKISAQWLARNDALAALMKGAECSGAACKVKGVDYGTTGTAHAEEDGHFYAPLTVNGKTIQGLIDTGASIIALNAEDAAELGIDFSSGTENMSGTANGPMNNRIVIVPALAVAGVSMDNVQVSCCINSPVSLIGMSFLGRVRLSVSGSTLTIQK